MYHSIEQTLASQKQAFKNEDLANIQIEKEEEEEKQSSMGDIIDKKIKEFIDSNETTEQFKEGLFLAV